MKKILGLVFILGILASILSYTLPCKYYNGFAFHPSKLAQEYTFKFNSKFKEITLQDAEQNKLSAVLLTPNKEPKATVLFFHGNSGNLQGVKKDGLDLTIKGYEVFAIDYHGFGKSEGMPSESSLYQCADLAYSWVKENRSGDVVIYGKSIGTIPASYLASKQEVTKLVLETPFSNLKKLLQCRIPILPICDELKNKFCVDKYLENVDEPVHIFFGGSDRVTPYCSSKNLKEKGSYTYIDCGTHNDLHTYDAFHADLKSFLKN